MSDWRLLTVIVPEDVDTVALAEELAARYGLQASFRHNARGVGRSTRRRKRRPLIPERRNLFTVLLPAAQADTVFDWLLQAARIDRHGGGLIYQQAAGMVMTPPTD